MCVYCLANNEQGVYRYNRSARSPHPTYLVAVFIPTHVFGVTSELEGVCVGLDRQTDD